MEGAGSKGKPELYTHYPAGNIVLYNGTTVVHYSAAALGIYIGYSFHWLGFLFAVIYFTFAMIQMYVIMPLTVCPNCVYYKLKGGRCTSGMNLVSRRLAKEGDPKNFHKRAGTPFCHNKMYMGSLIIPIPALIPALIVNFSIELLMLFFAVIGLLMFRMFFIFQRTACIHCRAKNMCPNAIAMGLADKKKEVNLN